MQISQPGMPSTTDAIHDRLRQLGNPDDARFLQRFFRTGAGEYGEGDRFLGIRVPVVRTLVREYRGLPLDDVGALLQSVAGNGAAQPALAA